MTTFGLRKLQSTHMGQQPYHPRALPLKRNRHVFSGVTGDLERGRESMGDICAGGATVLASGMHAQHVTRPLASWPPLAPQDESWLPTRRFTATSDKTSPASTRVATIAWYRAPHYRSRRLYVGTSDSAANANIATRHICSMYASPMVRIGLGGTIGSVGSSGSTGAGPSDPGGTTVPCPSLVPGASARKVVRGSGPYFCLILDKLRI
jgi:hypothetical protein